MKVSYPRLVIPPDGRPTAPTYSSIAAVDVAATLPSMPHFTAPLPSSFHRVTLPTKSLLPDYSPTSAPGIDTTFIHRSNPDVPIQELMPKYNALFDGHESTRQAAFSADMSLYDGGYEKANSDVKQSVTSRPDLFEVARDCFHDLFANDQERFAHIFTERRCQDEKRVELGACSAS